MAIHARIVLATDLSARSDRALDRAMMLAARESAELVVLHVIEPVAGNRYYPRTQPLPVLAALARKQLLHDLGNCAEKAERRLNGNRSPKQTSTNGSPVRRYRPRHARAWSRASSMATRPD
jgi:nucleotide-binding universal stress UspA family protein